MAQIIGLVIHKLKYCGRRRKYWFPAILYDSTLTLKAFLGSLTFLDPFPKQALVFTCLQYKSLENIVGTGEIAHNEQFLLFSRCFLPI